MSRLGKSGRVGRFSFVFFSSFVLFSVVFYALLDNEERGWVGGWVGWTLWAGSSPPPPKPTDQSPSTFPRQSRSVKFEAADKSEKRATFFFYSSFLLDRFSFIFFSVSFAPTWWKRLGSFDFYCDSARTRVGLNRFTGFFHLFYELFQRLDRDVVEAFFFPRFSFFHGISCSWIIELNFERFSFVYFFLSLKVTTQKRDFPLPSVWSIRSDFLPDGDIRAGCFARLLFFFFFFSGSSFCVHLHGPTLAHSREPSGRHFFFALRLLPFLCFFFVFLRRFRVRGLFLPVRVAILFRHIPPFCLLHIRSESVAVTKQKENDENDNVRKPKKNKNIDRLSRFFFGGTRRASWHADGQKGKKKKKKKNLGEIRQTFGGLDGRFVFYGTLKKKSGPSKYWTTELGTFASTASS